MFPFDRVGQESRGNGVSRAQLPPRKRKRRRTRRPFVRSRTVMVWVARAVWERSGLWPIIERREIKGTRVFLPLAFLRSIFVLSNRAKRRAAVEIGFSSMNFTMKSAFSDTRASLGLIVNNINIWQIARGTTRKNLKWFNNSQGGSRTKIAAPRSSKRKSFHGFQSLRKSGEPQ